MFECANLTPISDVDQDKRHQEDKQSKENHSLESVAKLERTQSNVQQNMEQTQNPTKEATSNNNSTALERTVA